MNDQYNRSLEQLKRTIQQSGCTRLGEGISFRVAAVALACGECKFELSDHKGSLNITPFFNWCQIAVADVSRIASLWLAMGECALTLNTNCGKSLDLFLDASDTEIAQAIATLVKAEQTTKETSSKGE